MTASADEILAWIAVQLDEIERGVGPEPALIVRTAGCGYYLVRGASGKYTPIHPKIVRTWLRETGRTSWLVSETGKDLRPSQIAKLHGLTVDAYMFAITELNGS
jgi:hypothetical protein